MSITRIKKGQIIDYMLEQILTSKNVINKVSENFNLSKTTIYRYLRELEEKGVIKKKNRGNYELVKTSYNFIYDNDGSLEEDYIYKRDIEPLISSLPENVRKIWIYSFTEMFNNAIEHSESEKISCHVECNYIETTILIMDYGVDIYKKIQDRPQSRGLQLPKLADINPDNNSILSEDCTYSKFMQYIRINL